jgi:hypothetical protein
MASVPNIFENITIFYIYKSSPMTSESTFFETRKVLGIKNKSFFIQTILIVDVNNAVHDHYVVVERKNIYRFFRQKRPIFIPCYETLQSQSCTINCKADLVLLIIKPISYY